jgi:protein-S-isoprenylcysteine O-methyltransferase Ste14
VNHYPFDFLNVIVLIFFLVFYLYWAITAGGVKKDVPGKGSRIGWLLSRLGLILVLVVIYEFLVLSPLWRFANSLSFFRNEAVRIAGAFLTAVGLAFAIWARLHLGRNWSARPTMKVGHELVTSGPYRIVRHPIYTGLLMAWFGFGLVYGLVSMAVFLAFALMFVWRIRVEEVYMIELFPDQYPGYCASTKTLIPAVW